MRNKFAIILLATALLFVPVAVTASGASGIALAAAPDTRSLSAVTVRVGYYNDEDKKFQAGSTDRDDRKSGYAYEYYQQIATFTDWIYEYVHCADLDDALDKLTAETPSVDIVAGVKKSDAKYDESKMTPSELDMGMDGLYFVVDKRGGLIDDLNTAMARIAESTPAFTINLYQKYYAVKGDQKLTEEEKQWLTQKKTLKLGYIINNLPISDKDESGQPIGLVKELIDMLCDGEDGFFAQNGLSDITVSATDYDTAVNLETALSNKEIDIIFPVYSDLWLSEDKGFKITTAIYSDRLMLIFRSDDDRKTDVLLRNISASPRAVGMVMYVQNLYPDIQSTIERYDSIEKAIDALSAGVSDSVLGSSSVLQRYWSRNAVEGLTATMIDKSAEFSLAVHNTDTELVGILNKYVNQLDSANVTSAIARYSVIESQSSYSFADFMRDNAIVLITIMLVVVAVIATGFAMYIVRAREFNEEQAKMRVALEDALETAKKASNAKTAFLSSMSHDIRTPMNAIVGMTNIANNHINDTARVKDCLEKIDLSSHHLLTLINDVLDISKIESGKLALNPVVFSLRDTVENLVNIVRPTINSKDLQFDVHLHGIEYETMVADEVRVNQIFVNILSNAVKYTPGGGKVILDLTQEKVSEHTVKLTYVVTDTGIGMSPEYMEHMYETFTRAEDSRTNKIQGTGLGLAIVKQMVTLMGGTIDCESELDKGTKFTVTLELPIGEKPEEHPTLPPVNVLVVDDDEIFLDCASDLMNTMGAKVDAATSGEQAVEFVKTHREQNADYDVIIIDWKMPGMNGLQTISAIRDVVGDDALIILVSAYDWSSIEDEAQSSGASGFISKPLFRSYIYEKLCEVLELEKEHAKKTAAHKKDLVGLNLLVAEDNELNWEVVSELLEMEGMTADRAENGMVCYEMLCASPAGTYDLILMDIQMPVLDGKEATKLIRANSNAYVNNVPIIAMTADAFAEDIAACLDAGMDGHAAKPIDMDKLCQEIRKAVKARKNK